MGFLARLSRVVPLLIVMAVAAGLIYVVVTYRHSPARAKEVLIKIFTWFNGIVVGFFALVSVYAFFDNAPAVLRSVAQLMVVGLAASSSRASPTGASSRITPTTAKAPRRHHPPPLAVATVGDLEEVDAS